MLIDSLCCSFFFYWSVFALDPVKVSLFHAFQLFAAQNPYPHLAFLQSWQDRMPTGMKVDVNVLKGHAICEVSAQLEAIARASSTTSGANASKLSEDSFLQWRYFPVTSLSPAPKTRFAQLFDVRAKWRLAEIIPYVAGLCTPGQTIEQLLLKMTRPVSTMENGQKIIVYTKR